MGLFSLIVENQELAKLVYTIVIGLVCFAIVLKTNKLFRLSLHQGIRYFRNAFFFYGIAFVSRYAIGTIYAFTQTPPAYSAVISIVFEFFLVMAGFFLFYSLLWRQLDSTKHNVSSLFNAKIFIFYFIAIIIALLDYFWVTYYFMFFSQIITFSFAGGLSFAKYSESSEKGGFLRLYFIVIMLNLVSWILNFVVASFFDWNKVGVMSMYLLNIFIFLLFLYGIIKVTKK